ncbi:MAG: hypothetical protein AB7U97_10280 [Pirellulales bacterium]
MHSAAALLRPERLLSEAVLPVPPALLAGVVFVRSAVDRSEGRLARIKAEKK